MKKMKKRTALVIALAMMMCLFVSAGVYGETTGQEELPEVSTEEYTIEGYETIFNDIFWFKSDATAIITAADGYSVSLTEDGTYSEKVEITADIGKVVHFKNAEGTYKGSVDFTGSFMWSKTGKTSVPIPVDGACWIMEDAEGSTTLFGLKNENDIFGSGSTFWIEEHKSGSRYDDLYNKLDAEHKAGVEANKHIMFDVGVTDQSGTEYSQLAKPVSLYIQIPDDWDENQIKAAFISSQTDEEVPVKVEDNDGGTKFAVMTVYHFSPYIIYDKSDAASTPAAEKSPNTGDTFNPIILIVVAVIAIAGVAFTFVGRRKK